MVPYVVGAVVAVTVMHVLLFVLHVCLLRLNTGCTSDAQVSAKHNTQIPRPAIYTENPDSQLTQT